MGHPVLRRTAVPVTSPDESALRGLAADMIDTMLEAPGVGLAAPQVCHGVRMVVIRVPADRSGGETVPPTVLVNPVVEPLTESMEWGLEGCLSVPGLRGMVPRYTRIGYRALTIDGTVIEREAAGFHARVVQHEVDHLDGILYIDRMEDLRLLAVTEEAHHLLGEQKETQP